MNFPRSVINVDTCVAIVCTVVGRGKPANLGKPITWRRPNVMYKGEMWRANRLSYHLNVGRIPRQPRNRKGGFILHTCDHDWCILPSHLYKGTQRDNIHDILERHPTIHESRSVNMIGNKLAVRK